MGNTGKHTTRCANTTTRTLMPSQQRERMRGPRVAYGGSGTRTANIGAAFAAVASERDVCLRCRYIICCCALNATAPIEPVKRDYGTCACGSSAVHQRTDACGPAPSERTIAALIAPQPAAHEPRVAVQVGDVWQNDTGYDGDVSRFRVVEVVADGCRVEPLRGGSDVWSSLRADGSCSNTIARWRLISRAEPEMRAGWRQSDRHTTRWPVYDNASGYRVALQSAPCEGGPWYAWRECGGGTPAQLKHVGHATAIAAMDAVDRLLAQQAAEAGADDAESGLRAMGFERTDDSAEGAMYHHPGGAWVALWKGGALWAGGRVGQGAAEHEHRDWRAAAAHALGRDGA